MPTRVDLVIPNAVILPPDSSGQAVPSQVNSTVAASTQTQIPTIGRDSIIPVIYGGPERVARLPYIARIYNGNLLLCFIICEGPVQQITNLELNDGSGAGISYTAYLGTQTQTVDPWLSAAIPGFADAMLGTAYVVCQVPPGISPGFPRITVEVTGKKIYDPRGSGLQLGSGNKVQSGVNTTIPSSGWTVEAWVALTSTNTENPAVSFRTGGFSYIGFGVSANNRMVHYYSTATPAQRNGNTALPTDGSWHHCAWVYDGTNINFYLDGVADGSFSQSGVANQTSNPVYIGWDNPNNEFLNGNIDEVRVWNVARTANQIADYYLKRAIGNESGLIRLWHMDEGTGTTTADATGNSAAATFGGSPTWITGRVLAPADVTQQWAWSDNPALCLADFVTNTVYGARKLVSWDWVATSANRCDELVTGTGGTEKRCLLTLSLADQDDVDNWIEVLRGYIPAWVDWVGPTAYIIPDMPKSPADHTFDSTSIDTEELPYLSKRGVRNLPNVVDIGYMKTDVKPWAMDYATADTSPTIRRKTRVDMPGIRRYSQAYRFAVERLNHYTLEAVEAVIAVFENGLKVMQGDLADVTDDIGLSATRMRVTGRQDRGHGRWLLGLRQYNAIAYNNTVQTAPSSSGTGAPDPKTVQPPTSLVITEEVFAENSVNPDSVSRGFIYQSRMRASWTASTHAYQPVLYRVRVKDGMTVMDEGTTYTTSYVSPAVQQGRTYTVEVYAQNSLGFQSSTLSGSLLALGKYLPPGNVPAITQAFELGGWVFLSWSPAIDIDIDRYEWRYGSTGGFSYATATLIDRVDGLTAQFKGIPVGTWRFAVKAMDSVGNLSATEATVDVTVTSDQDAFIQSHSFQPVATSAELVVNGDFASGTGWSFSAGTVTIGSGTLNFATTNTQYASRVCQPVGVGKWYRVKYDITSRSAGSIQVLLGSGNNATALKSAVGTYIEYIRMNDPGDGNVYVYCSGATTASVDNLSVTEVGLVNMIPYPYAEQAFTSRWTTSDEIDSWNSNIPNPVNSGVTRAVIDYHTDCTSAFVGSPWDLGLQVTGDWSLLLDYTVIDGTVTATLETSNDNVTWVQHPGTSWRGQARFIRPLLQSLTTGSFRINASPIAKIAAQTKNESGIASLTSNGLLVQLAGQYAAAQDLQATPVNNTESRNAVVDRILLNPQTGLCLYFDVASGDATAIQNISSAAYTIQTGDYLEYDVFIDSTSPGASGFSDGGMTLVFSDTTTIGAVNDLDGYDCKQPAIGFDALARGVWKSRKISLTSVVGKQTATWRIRGDSDGVGSHKVLFRNIRITDGASTTRVTAWSSGEPSPNTNFATGTATNVRVGPSNSFLLYLFISNTAAFPTVDPRDVRWFFSGF